MPAVIRAAAEKYGVGTSWPETLREFDPTHRQREQTNRHVDQKNPPPTGRDQQSAYQGSQSGGEPADRSPDADRTTAALSREGRQDQPQRRRGEQRRPGRLHKTERDQGFDTAREGAGGRRGGEHGDAREETFVSREAFGQPATKYQQRRVNDGIAVQNPGQIPQIRVIKLLRDVRQRHIDDEQVEIGQHDAGANDGQDLARPR